MTRCADLSRIALAALLSSALLAGCSSRAPRKSAPAPAPAPAAPAPAPVAKAPDKGDPDERFKAALAQMKEGQNAEAQAAFEALAKDFPEFSGPLTDLGIVLANGKQRGPAIDAFRRAVKANPQNVVAQNWLGTLLRELNDLGGAERAYQAAIAARPNYAPAHLNLGILYDVSLRRPADALVQYREYQRLTNGERLIVTAWIRQLESAKPAGAAAAPATPPAAANPAAPANAAPAVAVPAATAPKGAKP